MRRSFLFSGISFVFIVVFVVLGIWLAVEPDFQRVNESKWLEDEIHVLAGLSGVRVTTSFHGDSVRVLVSSDTLANRKKFLELLANRPRNALDNLKLIVEDREALGSELQ